MASLKVGRFLFIGLVVVCSVNQVLEEVAAGLIIVVSTFGMPLNTDKALVDIHRFHRFNKIVTGPSSRFKALTQVFDGLVVEGVHIVTRFHELAQNGVLSYFDGVGDPFYF